MPNDIIYPMERPIIQAIGLACIPQHDLDAKSPSARKPVAAAVVTIQQRDDGHIECVDTCISNTRAAEFPLPWLIDQALVPGALTIVSASDRETLGTEVMARRYFVETRLAGVVRGDDVVDPHAVASRSGSDTALDEAQLCRRLSIPAALYGDAEIERLWSQKAVRSVEEIALARAVSRMMLWAHVAALEAGDAGPFFEAMLALNGRLDTKADSAAFVYSWTTSRPVMSARSFVHAWRHHLQRRADGDIDSKWTRFEDGLFHT